VTITRSPDLDDDVITSLGLLITLCYTVGHGNLPLVHLRLPSVETQ
jgi:hypothetical protein